MKIKLFSSLEKVFPLEEPYFSELKEASALKNEPFSFQIALLREKGEPEAFSVEITSQLKNIFTYAVKNMPSELSRNKDADDFYYAEHPAYPDLLEPLFGKIHLNENEWSALWIKCAPPYTVTGKAEIKIKITDENGTVTAEKAIAPSILDKELPKQELLYTNWFHNDCLCSHYGVKIFSPEYWRLAESYIKNAVIHGMNMILTPIFTPPLDTEIGGERPTVQLVFVKQSKNGKYTFDYENFEKYVSMCLSLGIEAFEISHLFTQWGASAAPKIIAETYDESGNSVEKRIFGWDTDPQGEAYADFLEQFAASFNGEIEKLGIKNRIFMHVSDEPSFDDLEGYKKASKKLHALFPEYRFIDALSDIEFYKEGLCDTPIPNENNADGFFPVVKSFWTYYCCGQGSEYLPNRFFAMMSVRNRILGFLLYKYNAEGFLQWGHNFWYSQYSKRRLDPFSETAAGGAFPSGDAFVVYPGADFTPLNSLRHEVFYEGLCDLRALKYLEALTSREHALSVLEEGLCEPLTFRKYPHESAWLLKTRERINSEILKKENSL